MFEQEEREKKVVKKKNFTLDCPTEKYSLHRGTISKNDDDSLHCSVPNLDGFCLKVNEE